MTTTAVSRELEKRVSDAIERLMAVQNLESGKAVLSVPVTYPSGASVVVELEKNADRIWVSDMGLGMAEAEMMGADDSYQRLARSKAEEFGINYDNHAMFVLWVPQDRLEGAIVCVANASAQAAAAAVLHASEAQNRSQREAVFQRVSEVFGRERVVKSLEMRGRRTSWEAHNVVTSPRGQRSVFEPMTPAPQSVSSKFLMFSDLKEADSGASLNVVVESLKSLDAKAQIVSDVANIIELKAEDDVYRSYGFAA